jgi:hypothetical protein
VSVIEFVMVITMCSKNVRTVLVGPYRGDDNRHICTFLSLYAACVQHLATSFCILDYTLLQKYITLVNTIFVTGNVKCDSYVTFYAELKNVIRIFLLPIGFV